MRNAYRMWGPSNDNFMETRCHCKGGMVRIAWPPRARVLRGVSCDNPECDITYTIGREFDPDQPARAREADDETGRPPVPESAPPSSGRLTYQEWLDSRPLL